MTTRPNVLIRVTRRFDTPSERVFDAWLDPVSARKWLFATPTGTMVRSEIDPRVGGSFTLSDRREGEDVEHTGTYLEIDRPRRLAFTFGVPKYSPEFTRVTVEIEPEGASSCRLTLTQEMKPELAADWAERSEEGWRKILEGLASNLT